ncbi:MAG: hypothetical protein AAF587_26345 [Bacteroidota bacterium]
MSHAFGLIYTYVDSIDRYADSDIHKPFADSLRRIMKANKISLFEPFTKDYRVTLAQFRGFHFDYDLFYDGIILLSESYWPQPVHGFQEYSHSDNRINKKTQRNGYTYSRSYYFGYLNSELESNIPAVSMITEFIYDNGFTLAFDLEIKLDEKYYCQ